MIYYRSALIRAARTFAQTAIGVYLAGVGGQAADLEALADLGLIEAAVAAGFVSVLTFLQNLLETNGSVANYDRG